MRDRHIVTISYQSEVMNGDSMAPSQLALIDIESQSQGRLEVEGHTVQEAEIYHYCTLIGKHIWKSTLVP